MTVEGCWERQTGVTAKSPSSLLRPHFLLGIHLAHPSEWRPGQRVNAPSVAAAALSTAALQYVPPVLLRYLIRIVSDPTEDRDWLAYILAVGMFLALLFMSFVENQYFDVWYGCPLDACYEEEEQVIW